MLDPLLDHPLQRPDVGRRAPGDEARPRRLGQPAEIEGRLDLARTEPWSPGRPAPWWGELTPGHAVGLVVEQDAGDVDVAPAGVDQVVAADGRAVPVTGEHHHGEVGPGHLDAGGEGQRPAVDGVHGPQIDVADGPAGAADAADHHRLLPLEAQVDDGPQEGAGHDADAAARAPDVRQPLGVQELLDLEGLGSEAPPAAVGCRRSDTLVLPHQFGHPVEDLPRGDRASRRSCPC